MLVKSDCQGWTIAATPFRVGWIPTKWLVPVYGEKDALFKLIEEKNDKFWTRRKRRNKGLERAKQARIAVERAEEKSDKKEEDIEVEKNPRELELRSVVEDGSSETWLVTNTQSGEIPRGKVVAIEVQPRVKNPRTTSSSR